LERGEEWQGEKRQTPVLFECHFKTDVLRRIPRVPQFAKAQEKDARRCCEIKLAENYIHSLILINRRDKRKELRGIIGDSESRGRPTRIPC
jgi:hypothetical protein